MATAAKRAPAKAPAKKSASKEVALKKPGAVASPAAALFHAHAGAGMERVTAKDILVPRIGILQALSPQLSKQKTEYDPDAKVGLIYNVTMGEIVAEEQMMFIPLSYQKAYLEWYPRNTNKGLARIHDTDEILASTQPDDRGRPTLKNGNYVAETMQFYGLNITDGKEELCFVAMTSTQLKKGRQLLTMATSEKVEDGEGGTFTPPLFWRAYVFGTKPENNAEGDWIGWDIERGPLLQDMEGFEALFEKLVELNRQISAGIAKADLRGDNSDINAGGGASNSDRM